MEYEIKKTDEELPPVGESVLGYVKFEGWMPVELQDAREGKPGKWTCDMDGDPIGPPSHWTYYPEDPQ